MVKEEKSMIEALAFGAFIGVVSYFIGMIVGWKVCSRANAQADAMMAIARLDRLDKNIRERNFE